MTLSHLNLSFTKCGRMLLLPVCLERSQPATASPARPAPRCSEHTTIQCWPITASLAVQTFGISRNSPLLWCLANVRCLGHQLWKCNQAKSIEDKKLCQSVTEDIRKNCRVSKFTVRCSGSDESLTRPGSVLAKWIRPTRTRGERDAHTSSFCNEILRIKLGVCVCVCVCVWDPVEMGRNGQITTWSLIPIIHGYIRYTHTHTHTHTYLYLYIYIYI